MKCRREQRGWRGLARYLKKKKRKTSKTATGALGSWNSSAHVAHLQQCRPFLLSQVSQTETAGQRDPQHDPRGNAALEPCGAAGFEEKWPNSCRRLRQQFVCLAGNKYWLGGCKSRFLETKWTDGRVDRLPVEEDVVYPWCASSWFDPFVSLFSLLGQMLFSSSRFLELLQWGNGKRVETLCWTLKSLCARMIVSPTWQCWCCVARDLGGAW